MTTTEVTVPANSSLLYRELIKQKLTGDDLLTYLYCGYVIIDWRSRNQAADVAAISARLAACDADLQSALSVQAPAVAYPSAETIGLAASVGAIRGVGDDLANLLNTLVAMPAEAVRPLLLPEAGRFPDWHVGAFSAPAAGQTQPGTDAVLGMIADAVAADPVLRSALDSFTQGNGDKIGLAWPLPTSTTANSDVLNMDGDWPAPFKAGLQADGSVIVTVQALADEFNAQILAASAVASEMSGQVQTADASLANAAPSAGFDLGGLSADFNVVLAALSAARPVQADASNTAATAAQNNDAALKYAQNSISAIAQGIGIVDPAAANIVSVVGTAVISAATAINDFAKTTQTLSQVLGVVGQAAGAVANAIGSVLLGGNLVGAAMSIIGLFTGGVPSPETTLLHSIQQAITQLSQQVSALQQDVNTRLDHIDAMLSATLSEVESGFAALTDLAVINQVTLAGISSQLVELAEQLNRIDTDMQAWLQLVEVQTDLLEKGENPVLDWRYTHLDPTDILPYSGADPNFIATDNVFYTWATGIAVSEPQITVAAPPDPVSIAAQLTKPLGWNVNVLADALTNLKATSFYDGTSGMPLPNPVVWARAASDYAELQLEWLDYSKKLNGQRIADVAGPGVTLLGALATLATLNHPASLPAASPVFDGVRDGYLAALDGQPLLAGSPANLISALRAALGTWQRTYVDINGLPKNGTLGPDPFGLADQPLILGTDSSWGPQGSMPLGGEPSTGGLVSVTPPDQSTMIPHLPPVLHNYFYFNAAERGKFVLLLRDAGFLNPVDHIKWNSNHTDEYDWVTGTYGVYAEIRYNADGSADPASWQVVLTRRVDTGVKGGGTASTPGDQDTYAWLTGNDQRTGQANWDTFVLSAFSGATTMPLGNQQAGLDALIARLTPSVIGSLKAAQSSACEYLATAVAGSGPDSATVAASAQALSAWQELMIQLIRLALPGRILRDDLLRCLLYGPEAPPGQSGVAGILAARATTPQLGADICTELVTAASARIGALRDAVINALLALEGAGVYDWPSDVVNALLRLQAVAVARPDGPVITLPARTPGMAPVDPALWQVIMVGATGHFLGVTGAGAITAGQADGTVGQQWQLQVQPDASYQLVSRATGQCVGLSAVGQVILQAWANTSGQRWYLAYERPQHVRLVNGATGQSITVTLAVANAADQVSQRNYDGTSGQQFTIRPATPPQLETASSLGAGIAPMGGSVAVPLTIGNLGTLPLTINSITATGQFSASAATAQIPPGGQLTVIVIFTPSGQGAASGVLTIGSNDPSGPATVQLSGTGQGLAAPQISIDGTDAHGGYLVGITGAAGAEFFYTVDGTDPTPASTPFAAEFDVTPERPVDIIVKSIAVLAGAGISPVASLVLQANA